MSKQQSAIPATKVDGVDRPVLYSGGVQSNGRNIYHLPKETDDGRITTLCEANPRNIRVSPWRLFSRRRNPTLCGLCEQAGGEEYGDSNA